MIESKESLIEFAKTITRKEFLEQAKKSKMGDLQSKFKHDCPNGCGLISYDYECEVDEKTCLNCWRDSVKNIKFKDDLEREKESMENVFTKKDLKTGMIVRTKDNKLAMVLLNTNNGDIVSGKDYWCPLDTYLDNLKYEHDFAPEADILEVYQPYNNCDYLGTGELDLDRCKLIWQREGFEGYFDNYAEEEEIKVEEKIKFEDIYESGIEEIGLNWNEEDDFLENYDGIYEEALFIGSPDDNNGTYQILQNLDQFYEWGKKVILYIKQNQPKEMTQKEIESALGYKIKIVD